MSGGYQYPSRWYQLSGDSRSRLFSGAVRVRSEGNLERSARSLTCARRKRISGRKWYRRVQRFRAVNSEVEPVVSSRRVQEDLGFQVGRRWPLDKWTGHLTFRQTPSTENA